MRLSIKNGLLEIKLRGEITVLFYGNVPLVFQRGTTIFVTEKYKSKGWEKEISPRITKWLNEREYKFIPHQMLKNKVIGI